MSNIFKVLLAKMGIGRKPVPTSKQRSIIKSSVAKSSVRSMSTSETLPIEKQEQINKIIIQSIDELPPFNAKLYDLIHMMPSARSIVCPVEVSKDSNKGIHKFALIVYNAEVNADIIKSVTDALRFSIYKPADNPIIYASQKVLIELSRDNSNPADFKRSKSFNIKNQSTYEKVFNSVVEYSVKHKVSDIHFEIISEEQQSKIRFRIDGLLISPKEHFHLTSVLSDMLAYVYNMKAKYASQNMFNANLPQQCQIPLVFNGRKLLFRWASNQSANGFKVVLRLHFQDEVNQVRTLEQLGYLPSQIKIWKRAISRLGGGIILSGVVGSGKTTTMQTIIDFLPKTMSTYTVEDPVELLMPGVTQFAVSRNLSSKSKEEDPFIAVKRQLKRLDPDAVLIGEIRDYESGSLFRDIAESGHRALTTVHAPTAIDSITLRLPSEEIGIPKDVIATPGFINLLAYQALVPVLCSCCVPASSVYEPEYLRSIYQLFEISASKIMAKNKDGCPKCIKEALPEFNGFGGRIVVAEMVELDAIMRDLYLQGKNTQLKDYIRATNTSRFDEPESIGKSALEVAMYHVSQGTMDPVDVEHKFGSFEQYQREREL